MWIKTKYNKVWECVRVQTKQKNYQSAIAGLGAVHDLKTKQVWFWLKSSIVKGQTKVVGVGTIAG